MTYFAVLESVSAHKKFWLDITSSLHTAQSLMENFIFCAVSGWKTSFVERGWIPLLSLNELGEKSQAAIILSNFVNTP